MTSAPVDPKRCPLCSAENACGMAAGSQSCWCFSLDIAAEVLDRIPAEARQKACLCKGCASSRPDAITEPAPAEELVRRR